MISMMGKCLSIAASVACCVAFLGDWRGSDERPSMQVVADKTRVATLGELFVGDAAAASLPEEEAKPNVEPAAPPPAASGSAPIQTAQATAPVPPGSPSGPDSFATQLESAKASAMTRAQRRGSVRDDIRAYLAREGLTEGAQIINGSRVTVLVQELDTNKRPGERGFHLSRQTAFKKAYLSALSTFLAQRAQSIETVMGSVLRNVTNDDMRILQDLCAQSSAERMATKAQQLAEALLDSALKTLDVQPDPAATKPAYTCPAQEELFHSKIRRQASESISGLRIVHSSEVDGRVGVVLVHSSKFEDAARELYSGKFVRRTAGADYIAQTREEMARRGMDATSIQGMFGVRMVWLPDGEMVLISFGQADPDVGPSDSDRMIDMKMDAAKRRAENDAAAELARFARVAAVFSSEQEQWDNIGQYVDLKTGAKEEQVSMAESLLEKVNTSSSLKVQGVTRVQDWEVDPEETDPSQALVGVVVAWSPALQSTYGRDAARTDTASQATQPPTGGDTFRRKSVDMKEDW